MQVWPDSIGMNSPISVPFLLKFDSENQWIKTSVLNILKSVLVLLELPDKKMIIIVVLGSLRERNGPNHCDIHSVD